MKLCDEVQFEVEFETGLEPMPLTRLPVGKYYAIPAPVALAHDRRDALRDAVVTAAETMERNCGEWFDHEICPSCEKYHVCKALSVYWEAAQ